MRIAHLCQSYPPMVSGAAQVVYRLAHGMAARGHDLLVIAASDLGRHYARAAGRVRVVRLWSLRNPVRVGQHFVPWVGPVVTAELRRFGPDVLHLHDPLLFGLQGLHSGRALGLPIVLTLHGMPTFAASYAPRALGLRRLAEAGLWRYGAFFARRCQALVAPSEAVAAAVRGRGEWRPHFIGNGVDVDTFRPQPAAPGEAAALRHKYGLDPTLPVILYAGRLDVEKQVGAIVRAAAPALRAGRAQLLIAGDGTQRAALLRLAARLHLDGRAHFPGFVSPASDLPGLYRLATVFVMASAVEAQGIVVLEAAASALPVIAWEATSMPELVEHNRTGLLVPPGDEAALSAALLELIADPARARALGAAGRAKMVRQHSLASTLDAYEALYASLVECPADIEPAGSRASEAPSGIRARSLSDAND